MTFRCPSCGATVFIEQKICEYCNSSLYVTNLKDLSSFNVVDFNKHVNAYKSYCAQNESNTNANFSLALCYLKQKFYEKAQKHFDLAIENDIDNADCYFYAAVNALCGKKPFLLSRDEINLAENYINTALAFEQKAVYYYFLAYIRYDYFFRKSYKVAEDYNHFLNMAETFGITDVDKMSLFEILGQKRPEYI